MYIKKTDNPNMGRPTQNPKRVRLEVRLTEAEAEMLKVCAEKLGITRTDVITEGIKRTYRELSSHPE